MNVYSDNAEILLKVGLKIITLTPYPLQSTCISNTKYFKVIATPLPQKQKQITTTKKLTRRSPIYYILA